MRPVLADGSPVGEAVAAWVAEDVTAIAAYNDDVTAAVVGGALRAGLRVPDDLAVIGHDDTPMARLFVPSLSSVDVDVRGAGEYVAELALAAVRGTGSPSDQSLLRDVRVVRREST